MISALVSMVFNVSLLILLGERLGVGGIALLSGISAGVNMAVNLVFAVKHGLITPAKADIIDIIKSVISAAVMGLAAAAVYSLLADSVKIVSFAVPTAVGVIVYAVLVLVLRSEEMMGILKAVRNRK